MVCVMCEDAQAAAAQGVTAAAAAADGSSSSSSGALRPLVFPHKLQQCNVTALTLALAGTSCRVTGQEQ
jgi:hypothetical protein